MHYLTHTLPHTHSERGGGGRQLLNRGEMCNTSVLSAKQESLVYEHRHNTIVTTAESSKVSGSMKTVCIKR